MIYFIQQGKTGPIKIGYTSKNDTSQRIQSLQNASPETLILLGYIEGDKDKEALLHRFFHAHKLKGEWFEPCPMVLNYILSLILGVSFSEIQNRYENVPGFNDIVNGIIPLDNFLASFEQRIIRYALEKTGNNKQKSAEMLGISFRSIRHRIQKYKIT